jgi:hypothetical protein
MDRQPIVGVGVYPMVRFPELRGRIYVYGHGRHVGDVVQELMSDFFRDLVTLCHAEVRVDCYVQFQSEAMADPASADLGHTMHARHVACGVLDRIQHLWVDTIEHPGEDGAGGLPDEVEDHDRDQQPEHRVR